MRHAFLPIAVTLFVTPSISAQDAGFVRALERAQAQRPSAIATAARIAPEGEPGAPLVVHGQAFQEDGRTPLAGAIVFAYHTDREGLYDRPGAGAHSWRLRGWATTDGEGRFEFRTIRPGAYPSSRVPAHVHFTIFAGDDRYHAGELQFDDDPLVPARNREASAARGPFGSVQAVRREGATQHVEVRLKAEARQRF